MDSIVVYYLFMESNGLVFTIDHSEEICEPTKTIHYTRTNGPVQPDDTGDHPTEENDFQNPDSKNHQEQLEVLPIQPTNSLPKNRPVSFPFFLGILLGLFDCCVELASGVTRR